MAENPRQLTVNADESSAIGWFTFNEAAALVDDKALKRLIRKGRDVLSPRDQ
jgi:hypothetical protein